MRCKGITFCTSNNECVQKMHFLERFYFIRQYFLHKSKGMCNENTPQQHHNITTPSTIYVYRYPFTPFCLKTPKNGLKSPVWLDLSQLWAKNATFLKLFRQNICTERLFVIPLHPLSRTNETSSKTRLSIVREAKRKSSLKRFT